MITTKFIENMFVVPEEAAETISRLPNKEYILLDLQDEWIETSISKLAKKYNMSYSLTYSRFREAFGKKGMLPKKQRQQQSKNANIVRWGSKIKLTSKQAATLPKWVKSRAIRDGISPVTLAKYNVII